MVKKITSDEAYADALEELRDLFDARPGTPDYERLQKVSAAIEDYETDLTGQSGADRSGRGILQSVGVRVIGSFL